MRCVNGKIKMLSTRDLLFQRHLQQEKNRLIRSSARSRPSSGSGYSTYSKSYFSSLRSWRLPCEADAIHYGNPEDKDFLNHWFKTRKVTIYKRGLTHYLYFRENGKSIRRPVEGNLAAASAMAHKVAGSLQEGRPSPLGFQRIAPAEMVAAFSDSARPMEKGSRPQSSRPRRE